MEKTGCSIVLASHQLNKVGANVLLAQAWANYGPGAICGQFSFLIRPAEFKEIILMASKS